MAQQKLSRLELYVEILKSIEDQQQLKFVEIQEKTKVEKASLIYAIDFLEKQDLIKSKKIQNETVYQNTPRGLLVTKFFAERSEVARQSNLVCGVTNNP